MRKLGLGDRSPLRAPRRASARHCTPHAPPDRLSRNRDARSTQLQAPVQSVPSLTDQSVRATMASSTSVSMMASSFSSALRSRDGRGTELSHGLRGITDSCPSPRVSRYARRGHEGYKGKSLPCLLTVYELNIPAAPKRQVICLGRVQGWRWGRFQALARHPVSASRSTPPRERHPSSGTERCRPSPEIQQPDPSHSA
jgi:hypothetical protein